MKEVLERDYESGDHDQEPTGPADGDSHLAQDVLARHRMEWVVGMVARDTGIDYGHPDLLSSRPYGCLLFHDHDCLRVLDDPTTLGTKDSRLSRAAEEAGHSRNQTYWIVCNTCLLKYRRLVREDVLAKRE